MANELTAILQTVNAPTLLPDTIWDGYIGDWAPADPSEPSNRGGLRARAPLATAVLLCLMTDVRAGDNDAIPDGSDDPRGWAGDAIDPDIPPLGSKLWLLRRSTLDQGVADLAVVYARRALQPLIDQKAVAAIDVQAIMHQEVGQLFLIISLYRSDGSLIISMNFDVLWKQANGVYDPLSP